MRGSVLRWAGWPQRAPDARSVATAAGAIALVVGFTLVVAVAAMVSSNFRLPAIIAGVVAFPVLAQASGNPRLFCLWCLMIVLPLDLSMYLGPFSDKAGGERAFRAEVADLFFLSLLAFQLRDVLTRRWPGLRVPKVTFVWLGIMLFWGTDTVLNGAFRMTAVHEMVRMVKMAVLFVVIVNELDTPRRMLHAAMALSFSVLFESCVGLVQYWFGRPLGLEVLGEVGAKTSRELETTSVIDARVFRISALVGHPNLFGAYLAASLPLALGGLMVVRRLSQRLLFALAAALGGAALILTQSRSAWVGFAAAVALFAILMLMHRRLFTRSISAIAVGVVAAGLGFAYFYEPITKRLFESNEAATVGREEFKEDARRLIDDKMWFGWGLNQYVRVLPPYMKTSARAYSWWIPPVHNIYYLWWSETGLIGLATHLAMWAAILLMALRNMKVHDETLFIMNLACMAGMIAFVVDGFMSFTLRVNPPLRLYWVLAGMIYATYYWRYAQQRIAWPARATARSDP